MAGAPSWPAARSAAVAALGAARQSALTFLKRFGISSLSVIARRFGVGHELTDGSPYQIRDSRRRG